MEGFRGVVAKEISYGPTIWCLNCVAVPLAYTCSVSNGEITVIIDTTMVDWIYLDLVKKVCIATTKFFNHAFLIVGYEGL